MHPLVSASRAQTLGIMAVVSAIFVLVSMILLWILYARTRFGLYLWFAIMGIVFFLVALAVAGMSFAIKGGIAADRPEKKLFSAIIYIGSAASAVFLLGTVLVLVWYKYIHFNKLLTIHQDSETFDDRYPSGWNFDDAWKSDRRMIWWIAFFNLFAAVFLGICAFLMWSISKFMIQLARGLLAICGAISILFCCLCIYQCAKALKGPAQHSLLQEFFSKSDVKFLMWFAIIIGILILINLIFNIVKKRIVYFILGVLLLIFVLVFAIKAAEVMRRIRQFSGPGQKITDRNMELMRNIHEEDLAPFCPKYIDENCGKRWIQVHKEGNMSRRTLNPACARAGLLGLLEPIYWAAIYALFAALFAAVVIACDFYLSDTTEFLETFNRETSIFDYLGLALALIFIIIALIWILATNFGSLNEMGGKNNNIEDDLQKGKIHENDFEIVPTKIRETEQSIDKLCTKYDSSKMVKLEDNPSCSLSRCGYRLFILSEYTQFGGVDTSNMGDAGFRTIAFPGAENELDSFLFLKGTASEINAELEKLRFCPVRYGEENSVFYKVEEVNLDDLDGRGALNGENPTAGTYSSSGNRGFPSGYSFGTNLKCSSDDCKFENRYNPTIGTSSVVVDLYAKNQAGVYENPSDDLLKDIEVSVYHGNTRYAHIPAGSVPSKGILSVPVPVATSPYVAKIFIKHVDNLVVPIEKSFIVQNDPSSKLSIGRLPLMLPDGAGCSDASDFNNCAQQHQNSKTGTLKFKVIDKDKNEPISGADVALFENHLVGKRPDGQSASSDKTTDSDGIATFKDLPYGFYTSFTSEEGFVAVHEEATLESDESTLIVYLNPNKLTAMDATMLMDNQANVDLDLKVKFQNDKGKECLVSSENKYCGYALYIYDVKEGKSGVETIRIHNMTYSHYMVYAEALYGSNGSCGTYRNANKHFAEKFDWNKIQAHKQGTTQERPNTDPSKKFWVSQCFTGFGQISVKNLNERFASDPNISVCKNLFPSNDRYSLDNLRKAVAAL